VSARPGHGRTARDRLQPNRAHAGSRVTRCSSRSTLDSIGCGGIVHLPVRRRAPPLGGRTDARGIWRMSCRLTAATLPSSGCPAQPGGRAGPRLLSAYIGLRKVLGARCQVQCRVPECQVQCRVPECPVQCTATSRWRPGFGGRSICLVSTRRLKGRRARLAPGHPGTLHPFPRVRPRRRGRHDSPQWNPLSRSVAPSLAQSLPAGSSGKDALRNICAHSARSSALSTSSSSKISRANSTSPRPVAVISPRSRTAGTST
jgi:hypothetical protein